MTLYKSLAYDKPFYNGFDIDEHQDVILDILLQLGLLISIKLCHIIILAFFKY